MPIRYSSVIGEPVASGVPVTVVVELLQPDVGITGLLVIAKVGAVRSSHTSTGGDHAEVFPATSMLWNSTSVLPSAEIVVDTPAVAAVHPPWLKLVRNW